MGFHSKDKQADHQDDNSQTYDITKEVFKEILAAVEDPVSMDMYLTHG